MDKDINLVEILKDAPIGTKLWSPICGECEFMGLLSSSKNLFKIRVKYEEKEGNTTPYLCFSSQGKYCNTPEVECLLFPSKENRDWSTFIAPKHFEPFQKVLRLDGTDADHKVWVADVYSHYDESIMRHFLISGFMKEDNHIIPYEGNEEKLGKYVEE